jgi:outer membrane lipoprotein carrier protein
LKPAILLTALLGACLGSFAGAETPGPASTTTAASAAPAASGKLGRYLDGLKTFEAQFRQTLQDSRGRITEEAGGRLYLEKPGRFRWEYAKPNEQVIVSDSKNLWLYDVDLEQVTVKPLDASLAATPASLLAGQARVDESFTIVAEPASADGVEWFVLTPKRVDTDFTRLRLGLSGGALKVMELQDKLQQHTTIEFSAVKRNPRLGRSLFVFEPPAGVDVIGTPRR